MSDLSGKTAVVIGTASPRSMGRACAMRLAKEGANVVLADITMKPRAINPEDEGFGGMPQEVEEIEAAGGKAIAVLCDVSKEEDIKNLMQTAVEAFGTIDFLIHCTGIRQPVASAVDIPVDLWKKMIDTNLTGPFLTCREAAKVMLKDPNGTQGKKILAVASQASVHSVLNGVSYCASKHGLIGIIRTMAIELAKYGICVNAISPGDFNTNFRDKVIEDQAKKQGISIEESFKKGFALPGSGASNVPLGRSGEPEDFANLVSFLVSDNANYITGQNIFLNGGLEV